MKLTNFSPLLGLLAILAANPVMADFVGVPGPSQWNRGDANTGFLDFDTFFQIPFGGAGTGSSPASGTGGGMTGTIQQVVPIGAPGGILGPAWPADNRLYAHLDAVSWTISVDPSPFDVNFIELHVKEVAGDGLAGVAIFANGEAPDGISVLDDGFGNSITKYYWGLAATIAAGTSFDITLANGPFSFDSYDSFALDASAVPVPAAVWLFGSALLGVAGISRKKKS